MAGFPVVGLGFAAGVESVVASGARGAAGLGLAEALGIALASILSVLAGVGVTDGFDWLRARGCVRSTRAAASTRGFIGLESLLGSSQIRSRGHINKDVTRSAGVNQNAKFGKNQSSKVETQKYREDRFGIGDAAKRCLRDSGTLVVLLVVATSSPPVCCSLNR